MRASSSFSSFLPGWYRAGPELDFLARCLVSDAGLEEGEGPQLLPLAAVLLEGPPGSLNRTSVGLKPWYLNALAMGFPLASIEPAWD